MKYKYYQVDAFTDKIFKGNPAGVKACLKIKGVCQEHVRLPLTSISRTRYNQLKDLLI